MSIEPGTDERRAVTQKARTAVLDALRALGGEAARKDVLHRALHYGGFSAEELAVVTPDRSGRERSFVESRLSFELSNLKREGLLENPERGVWRLTEAGRKKPEPLIQVRVSLDRLAELRAMSQDEYLDTPEWQRTRAAALDRADHRCSRDRRHKDQVDVHHTIRVRIGAELPSDLVVLCRGCYQQHHTINARPQAVADPTDLVQAASIAPPTLAAAAPAPQPSEEPDSDRSLLKRIFKRAA